MAMLITGGAGFIGCNLAATLLRSGEHVTIIDNLSRAHRSEPGLATRRSSPTSCASSAPTSATMPP